ncbi:MAG: DUF2807 domain-containing protein [Victivallales bacterium]|nr:DUF2807 domain-containing protein [Victivallales bacterium]
MSIGKKTLAIIFVFFIFIATSVSGKNSEKDIKLDPFSKINLECIALLHIKKGTKNMLKVKADTKIIDSVQARVKNDTLTISSNGQTKSRLGVISDSTNKKNIKLELILKNLQKLSTTSFSTINIDFNIKAEKFVVNNIGNSTIKLKEIRVKEFISKMTGAGLLKADLINAEKKAYVSVSGSGIVNLHNIKTPTADLEIFGTSTLNIRESKIDKINALVIGSGTVSFDGKAGYQSLQVKGTGRYYSGSLICEKADIKAIGSSNIVVNVKKELSINIVGNSIINVADNPEIKSKKILGSGSLILTRSTN